MKLWVDDTVPPPHNHTWIWAKTYKEAKSCISDCFSPFEQYSLDHDLGGKKTGLDLLIWMEKEGIDIQRVKVHSKNPVGAARMRYFIDVARDPEHKEPGYNVPVFGLISVEEEDYYG
jgi:hypothetical protein